MSDLIEPWGQLVSTTEIHSEPVMMKKTKFSIGRSPACDLNFNGNKLVSGVHCVVERDARGRTWLEDKSTNGTLLNLKDKITKKRVELEHGDEIYLVYRKASPETDIAFVFQDVTTLQAETSDSTIEYIPSENDSMVEDYTQKEPRVLTTTAGDTCSSASRKTDLERKRKCSESSLEHMPNKKICMNENVIQDGTSTNDELASEVADDSNKVEKQPRDEVDHKEDQNSAAKESQQKGPSKLSTAKVDETTDEMLESLMCIICQEVFYNCIGLQPCMHSFCAGCYSDWMPQSDECPSCRGKVTRINKNHLINNLVEAYLKAHPDKQRPQEDLDEQDRKNKITKDMLYPKEELRRGSDSDFSGSDDSGDNSGDNSDNGIHVSDAFYLPMIKNRFPTVPDYRTPISLPTTTGWFPGRPPPFKTVCRQCPEYTGPYPTGRADGKTAAVPGVVAAAAPSSSTGGEPTAGPSGIDAGLPDVKTMPPVPAYICTPNQTHALCRCCREAMPRRDPLTNPNIPPISCEMCYGQYCHAYWGCYENCAGCLNSFKEMAFGKDCLRNIVLDNMYESAILENYMKQKNMSVRDLLAVCLRRLEGGAYKATEVDPIRSKTLTGNTIVCKNCGLKLLKELAYQYRRDITKQQLPVGVISRPDCHWGKNCRTQRNKPHHAARFNHICDQTMNPV